jgi:hypothetical protein
MPSELSYDSTSPVIVNNIGTFTGDGSTITGSQNSDDSWTFEWNGCQSNTGYSTAFLMIYNVINPDYAAPTSPLSLSIYEGTSADSN